MPDCVLARSPALRFLRAMAAALLLVCGISAHAAPGQPPQRIISLLPSLTETVCELGACDRLVGVDDYSNWPPQVRALPRVGGIDDASVERIVALKPDLILTAPSARVLARLRELQLPVLVLYPEHLADVRGVYLSLGKALAVTNPAAAWGRTEAALEAAVASLPAHLRGTTVYFEVDGESYAAGEASFIGELMSRAGLRNVVPATLGAFPQINPEFVMRADPAVIMLTGHGAATLSTRPGWSRLRALRERRVCVFDRAQGDVLVRPGPRLAQAAQLLVDCVAGRLPVSGKQP